MTNKTIGKDLILENIDDILNILDNPNYSLNLYVIEDTKSKAKNKAKWYNVYDTEGNKDCKDDFLNETLKTLQNIKLKLKANDTIIKKFLEPDENDINGDIANGKHNIPMALFESPFDIDTFSEIFRQVSQGGRGKMNIKKSIGGYVYDINFGKFGRVMAFTTNRRTTIIKKGSMALIDKMVKLENDITAVPLHIDFLYIEYNGFKYLLIINKQSFEKLLKYYTYYKEISKKCVHELLNLNIIKITNDEVKEEILKDRPIIRKITQMYEYGAFKFCNDDGTLNGKYQKFIKLLKSSKEKATKVEITYTITTDDKGNETININSKDAMLWLLHAYNKNIVVDVLGEETFLSNSKSKIGQTKIEDWVA